MTTNNCRYSVEESHITIDARHFVKQYREVARFETLCRDCGGYGKRWCCPPVETSFCDKVLHLPQVTLVATVITPAETGLPLKYAIPLMRPEIDRLNRRSIELEKVTGGVALGFAGECYYCGKTPCSRLSGEPCRHPDLVRPSLEALGFNLQTSAHDLLHIDLAWSDDGKTLPPQLTILTALFHSCEPATINNLLS